MVYAWTDRWVRILTSMQMLSRETRNLVHTLTRTARVGLFVINGGVITKVSSASRSVSSAGCVRELCMMYQIILVKYSLVSLDYGMIIRVSLKGSGGI